METNQDSGQSSGSKPCRQTIVILWEETPPLRSQFPIQPAAIAVDLPSLHRALEYSLANIWIWSSGRYSCVPGSETPSIWVVGDSVSIACQGWSFVLSLIDLQSLLPWAPNHTVCSRLRFLCRRATSAGIFSSFSNGS